MTSEVSAMMIDVLCLGCAKPVSVTAQTTQDGAGLLLTSTDGVVLAEGNAGPREAPRPPCIASVVCRDCQAWALTAGLATPDDIG